MKRQSGFTLIELVMVIVILGILAATALPKFVNLKADAEIAATQGIAGAISSGNTINFANWSLHGASGVGVAIVSVCTDAGLVLDGGMPAGYNLAASGAAPGGTGLTGQCTLTSQANPAASAVYVITRTL